MQTLRIRVGLGVKKLQEKEWRRIIYSTYSPGYIIRSQMLTAPEAILDSTKVSQTLLGKKQYKSIIVSPICHTIKPEIKAKLLPFSKNYIFTK